jgi:hypothetical protein
MKKITALFFFITIALVVFLFLYFKIDVFGATIFEDDFDNYIDGALQSQNGWTCQYNNWSVNTEDFESNPKSIKDNAISYVSYCQKNGNYQTEGSFSFWFKTTNCGYNTSRREELSLMFSGTPYENLPRISIKSVADTGCEIGLSNISTEYVAYDIFDDWTQAIFRWRIIDDWYWFKWGWGGNAETDWTKSIYTIGHFPSGFNRLYVYGTYGEGGNYFYVDSIEEAPAEAPPPPLPFRVWGISPASGTEITSTSTEFSFGWESLATSSTSYYQGFWLNFREKTTGIKTEGYLFTTAEPTGTATTSLENFNFVKNSDYYLTAVGAGYTYGYYTDLVSPEFYYTINIAGLPDIFKMTDFSTWYSENSKFATPTAIFVSLTGFLEPVFSKIGEFGERTTEFFDLDDAYTRGYDIGIIFPTFTQYVNEIEVFMGGFPILKLFLITLLVLVGIFIIKLIMKFIPFFG